MPQIVSAMADNPVLQLKPWRHQIDIPLADRFPPGPFKGLLTWSFQGSAKRLFSSDNSCNEMSLLITHDCYHP